MLTCASNEQKTFALDSLPHVTFCCLAWNLLKLDQEKKWPSLWKDSLVSVQIYRLQDARPGTASWCRAHHECAHVAMYREPLSMRMKMHKAPLSIRMNVGCMY